MAEADVAGAIEDLKSRIGVVSEPGEWYLMTQEAVNAFADATGDHQWIHVDPERAKNGPFGGTIAHGFFTLSLVLQLQRGREEGPRLKIPVKMGVNYGLNRVRFPSPVPVGKRIRARSKLLSAEEVQPNVIQQVTEISVEVEGQDKPACVAEMVSRMYV
ncbi:MAG: MaoC family dehydratase [Chloroflexota bacterium]|nr:MaoC family dehydratase [Chloroflexota bacterium]